MNLKIYDYSETVALCVTHCIPYIPYHTILQILGGVFHLTGN